MRKITALAGGVGGAKLVDGLNAVLSPEELTIIVNVGDDFEHLGLKICPDLDTVCYTLSGLADPIMVWGRKDETWRALEVIEQLGGVSWFKLGDADLGLHIERTRRLKAGSTLTEVTQHVCKCFGIQATVLPATNQTHPTFVETDAGVLPFQEYFVHQRCEPRVHRFYFPGSASARPAPGVLESIRQADFIIFCPSNPWVSIDPILAIPGVREEILGKAVVAVSPIIGGKAVKGPAAKMYQEMGILPSAKAVARHYQNLLELFVIDVSDKDLVKGIETLGIRCLLTQTIMKSVQDRRELAQNILDTAYTQLSITG